MKLEELYGLGKVDLLPPGGTPGQILSKNSPAAGDVLWADAAGGGKAWQTATADTAAVAGDAFLVDTTAGPVKITLPAAPALGDEIWFEDVAGNFGTNKLTVAQGGNPIMGLAEDMDAEMDNAMFGLVFADATKGWRII